MKYECVIEYCSNCEIYTNDETAEFFPYKIEQEHNCLPKRGKKKEQEQH